VKNPAIAAGLTVKPQECRHADRARDPHRHEADQQRDRGTVHHLCEHVDAGLIGAE
jgi:hypothetical protein